MIYCKADRGSEDPGENNQIFKGVIFSYIHSMDPPLCKFLPCVPVCDLVFSFLSPPSLVRIALTCRAAYLAVVEVKTRAFNIDRHFSRFFTNSIAFRCLLDTHHGHSFEVAQFLVKLKVIAMSLDFYK